MQSMAAHNFEHTICTSSNDSPVGNEVTRSRDDRIGTRYTMAESDIRIASALGTEIPRDCWLIDTLGEQPVRTGRP
jgi:hypothetical protein